jgi:hypothetical protein
MEPTPFAFLAAAERTLAAVLPAELPGGGKWNFQRFINFSDQSGSLEIGVEIAGQGVQGLGVLHARMTFTSTEPLLQGWIQFGDHEMRVDFTLNESDGPKADEEVFALAEGWAIELTRAAQEQGNIKKSSSPKTKAAKANA